MKHSSVLFESTKEGIDEATGEAEDCFHQKEGLLGELGWSNLEPTVFPHYSYIKHVFVVGFESHLVSRR